MKAKKICRILSLAMAGSLTFTSVDLTAAAKENARQETVIQEQVTETEESAGDIVKEKTKFSRQAEEETEEGKIPEEYEDTAGSSKEKKEPEEYLDAAETVEEEKEEPWAWEEEQQIEAQTKKGDALEEVLPEESFEEDSKEDETELQWIAIQTKAPEANIESGTSICQDTVIRLFCETPDADIYYTTDGTEPSIEEGKVKGELYTDGIKAKKVMRDSEETEENWKIVSLAAIAVKEGNEPSKVQTFSWQVVSESERWGDIREEDRKLYATDAMPQGDASKVPKGMWIAGIEEDGYPYSGSSITMDAEEIRVYDEKTLLIPGRDYRIAYKNNKNVYQLKENDAGFIAQKAPTLTITGKGNYSGSIVRYFRINKLDLSSLDKEGSPVFSKEDITLPYNGNLQKGTTKVTFSSPQGKTIVLKAARDFNYVYPQLDEKQEKYDPAAYREAGEYTVLIEGKGNFTGTLEVKETITKQIPLSKVKVAAIRGQDYTGSEIKPKVTLQYKGQKLTEYDENTQKGDYTLTYDDNVTPGTASVRITGKGEYAGTRTVTFKIKGRELKKAGVRGFYSAFTYTGDPIEQTETEIFYCQGGKEFVLKENEHYKVTYDREPLKAGNVTVTYTGIEEKGWVGTIKKKYKITAYDLNADPRNRITVTDLSGREYPQEVSYVKKGAKPQPKICYTSPEGREYILLEGTDYKLAYGSNKALNDGTGSRKLPVIKITGKGNFKGTRQKETFRIVQAGLDTLTLKAADKFFQNKAGNYKTSVTITDIDGSKLKAGTDYEKEYAYYYAESVILADGTEREAGQPVGERDIVPKGAVLRVVVTGKGNYKGRENEPSSAGVQYRIVGADIAKAEVKVNKQYYTGREICPDKSHIVVKLNNNVLKAEDYEILSYENNVNKGKAKLTIKGRGNYGGCKTAEFTIADRSMYCRIAFLANGADSGTMKDQRIEYGKDYTLNKNTYKRKGYVFVGWNTEADGSGMTLDGRNILYEDQAKNPVVIGQEEKGKTLTLYAQWKLVSYEISYRLGGGVNHENNPSSYTVYDEIRLLDPVKEGYAFAGWYTDSKFTESKKITKIQKGSLGNKVLYAKWRETFVGEYTLPEEGTYLNVYDFGAAADDGADDTNAIESAVRQASSNYAQALERLKEEYPDTWREKKVDAINTVYVPAGVYKITAGHAYNDGDPGISMKSNVNLIFAPEAILEVASSKWGEYCVISAKNVENITIQGGKLKGERYRHQGNYGEDGHGIALFGAKNIEISDMSIEACWGDGVYLGTQAVRQSNGSQKYIGCENVMIRNCDIFDNRRSNISVTDGDDLTLEHCLIFDAHGTAPQCGICIEPNSNSSGDRICRNIVLSNTTIKAYGSKNAVDYMCFMTHHNPYVSGYTTADGIWFKNCTFYGWVGNYSGNNLHVDSKTVIHGTFDNHR